MKNENNEKGANCYVGYIRVSSRGQALYGTSIEVQTAQIENFANKYGVLQSVYCETVSGSLVGTQRTVFLRAVNECIKTGAILLVTSIDRLGRNLKNYLNEVWYQNVRYTIIEKGANVYGINEIAPYNDNTLHVIEMQFAQSERIKINKRTQTGRNARKEKGVKNISNITNETRLKANIAKTQIALNNPANILAYEFIKNDIEYYSLAKLAKKLNDNGLKTRNGKAFLAQTVKQLLALFSSAKTKQVTKRKEVAKVVKNALTVQKQVILAKHKEGLNYSQIARYMNEIGVKSENNKVYFAQTVKRVILAYEVSN